MDELVKLVVQKTGLDESVAKQVVDLVVSYLTKKLPSPAAKQVKAILNGEGVTSASGIMSILTSLFKR